jgi:hypothetical protein
MSALKLRTSVADGVLTITLDDPQAKANLEKRKPNFSGR